MATLTENYLKLKNAINDIKTSLSAKLTGGVVELTKLSQVPDYIRQIELGTVYGVKVIEDIEDTAERISYIDENSGMSPISIDLSSGSVNYNNWDKTWIPDHFKPCMLKTSGEVDYYLNPNDYSKKLEGGNSDVSNLNYDGNAMVEVKKFYTKFSMDGENEVMEVCEGKRPGFEAIGFQREDGSVADKIYLPMFLGYIHNGKLRSIMGVTLNNYDTIDVFRKAAQANGEGYDLEYYSINQVTSLLFIMMFKNFNVYRVVGAGRSINNNLGFGKTGICSKSGPIFTNNEYTTPVKFLHMEDFIWADMSGPGRYELGLLGTKDNNYIKMRPPYSTSDIKNYTPVPEFNMNEGYISQMKCSNEFGRYPVAFDGSSSKYEDAFHRNAYNLSEVRICCKTNETRISGRYIYMLNSEKTAVQGAMYNYGSLTYIPPA